MVSRDTAVHLAAIAVGFGVLAVWSLVDGGLGLDGDGPSVLGIALAFGWYFVVFAGAHLYLAARGEAGMVPTATRWRFVAVVAAALLLAGLGLALTAVESIFGLRPELPVFATAIGLFVGWFFYEARAGYRDPAPSD